MNANGHALAVRTHNVVAGYGTTAVLHDISFEAPAGELLAIVGPNGAGKSTLLKTIAGTLAPWQGEIELLGRRLSGYQRRALARSLAVVAQENSVAFQFSVLEVVLMGRAPHLGGFHLESRRDVAIAEAALRRFGLLELAGRPLQELSGGERKCVFLARALAQEPRVILLDEPTAFLDLRHVAEIFARFRQLCVERALTVIATLHDLNTAALYADRVLLLKDGSVVAHGRPAQVLTAENLRAVYETDVYVGRHPLTGALIVLPALPTAIE
ncbi:MAG: heme ABC transporter ATP-binding protein [Candidatus Binataceae bacterium]